MWRSVAYLRDEIIMSTNHRDRTLAAFRQSILETLFWKHVVAYTAAFLFLWGIAVLAFRVGGFDEWKPLCFGLLGLLAVPLLAWFVARREIPNDRKLGAILDRDNEVGGLLMSSLETDIGDWENRVEKLRIPKLQWDHRRTAGAVCLATCFAVTALFFPISAVSGSSRQRLNVDDQISKLTTQLETLNEEKLLDIEEVKSLKIELEKIKNEAEGAGPVKTFDALDHLAQQMNQKAAEAVENAQKTTETLAKTETLTQSVKEAIKETDAGTSKSLMEGLAQSLESMMKDNEQLRKDLQEQLAKKDGEKKKGEKGDKKEEGENEDGEKEKNGEKGENGEDEENAGNSEKQDAMKQALQKMLEENNFQNLTPEQLEQLAEAMKNAQGNAERMVENLQNGGFPMDPELLKDLAELKKHDKAEAERMLSELWEYADGGDGEKGDEGEKQRARSDKSPRYKEKHDWTTDPDHVDDMRFEKDPDEEGAEFHAKFLPPSDLEAFRNSQKIGASIAAPETNKKKTGVDQGGALQQTEGGIGTAHGQTIYPQHRGAVGRYFDKQ